MRKLLLSIFLITFFSVNSAYSAGMVYDPSEFVIDEKTNDMGSVKLPDNDEISSNIKISTRLAQETVSQQSDNFNNALFELDSAQVNIRNELLDYKAKYQEVDTQYQLIKEQRKVLAEQIRNVEKRVRDIERSKNQIRKTMI